MTGLIWTIQLVHYPTFDHVADDHFADFAKFHASRISLIVLPAMIVELFTAFMMLKLYSWSQLNIISILIIWASTFFLSVPCLKTSAIKR